MPRKERRKTAARRRAEDQGSFQSTRLKNVPEGTDFLKLEAKVMRLDIIPYRAGEGNPYADKDEWTFERTFFVHWDVGPNNDAYVCPRQVTRKTTNNKRCPICEHRAQMERDGIDRKVCAAFLPKERQLFQVVDLSVPEEGIKLWECSYHNFGKQLDAKMDLDEDDELGYAEFFFADEAGKTVIVKFEEKSMGGDRTFLQATSIDFKARKKLPKDLLRSAVCLDDLIEVLPYDKLKAIFDQEAGVDDHDDDDDTADAPTTHRVDSGGQTSEDDDGDDDTGTQTASDGDDDDWLDDQPAAKEEDTPDDDGDDWLDDDDTPPRKTEKKKKEKEATKAATKSEDSDDEWDDDWG